MDWYKKFFALVTGILLGSGPLLLGLYANNQTSPWYSISLIGIFLGILTGAIAVASSWHSKNWSIFWVCLGGSFLSFAITLALNFIWPVYQNIFRYGPGIMARGFSDFGWLVNLVTLLLGLAGLMLLVPNIFRED